MAALPLTRGWMSQDAPAALLGLSFLSCHLKGLDEKPQVLPFQHGKRKLRERVARFPEKTDHRVGMRLPPNKTPQVLFQTLSAH